MWAQSKLGVVQMSHSNGEICKINISLVSPGVYIRTHSNLFMVVRARPSNFLIEDYSTLLPSRMELWTGIRAVGSKRTSQEHPEQKRLGLLGKLQQS